MKQRRGIWILLTVCMLAAGCSRSGPIEVDMTSTPVRFVVDHRGWPRPLWWPQATEFAVACGEGGEEGELVWHLESDGPRGEPAHQLAFIYGRVPPGFHQVFPEQDKPPKPLEPGRVYYVAAAGEHAVYRMAFSLPIDWEEFIRGPTTTRRAAP